MKVSFKISDIFSKVSQVSTDSLSFAFFDLVFLLGSVCFGDSLVVDMFSAMLTGTFYISRKFHQKHLRSENLLPMVQRCGKFDLPFFSYIKLSN